MEDALSEVTRKNVWEWYTGTAYNRLMPKGAIVVINHECTKTTYQAASWPNRLQVGTFGKLLSYLQYRKRTRLFGRRLIQ